MASNETHLRVLRLLQANPHMTSASWPTSWVSVWEGELLRERLLVKGLIKMRNFSNSRNKLSYAYLLTPSGVTAKARLTAEYLRIKVDEYASLKREIAQLRLEASTHDAKERSR